MTEDAVTAQPLQNILQLLLIIAPADSASSLRSLARDDSRPAHGPASGPHRRSVHKLLDPAKTTAHVDNAREARRRHKTPPRAARAAPPFHRTPLAKMEEQLVRLLADTQSPQDGPRKQAELQLEQLYPNEAFPLSLVTVASHDFVPLDIRQCALLTLRTYVVSTWSAQFDEFKGQLVASEETKSRLRHSLLELATSNTDERKIKTAASYVVSKIASADFPDQWPDLLPGLLNLIPNATDAQLHGALKVLGDLIDECFNEAQFFQSAGELVKTMYSVATSAQRKPSLRALAVSVFRSCFDTLEMVMEDHKQAVKGFADETLSVWLPFFIEALKTKLPDAPSGDESSEAAEIWRGLVVLKLQVVKVGINLCEPEFFYDSC